MNIDIYIELLKQKQEVLNNIYKYTQGKLFEVSEDEVDRIIYYLDNRQKMFDKLNSIQDDINKIKLQFNNINNMEVNNIIKTNDLIIKEITKLDKEKNKIMESIFNLLKKEIKNLKNISKVNNSYLGIYENTIKGNLFDSSR
ncbi:hypothetical protein [[Clostridium] colinum]|uniref:hypothetical protein n=1 Tax=[Clostridium] colinum TaxID=36835 RepID=UPI0020246358|nr:hypothetical protein [[Clostridium] colinum]